MHCRNAFCLISVSGAVRCLVRRRFVLRSVISDYGLLWCMAMASSSPSPQASDTITSRFDYLDIGEMIHSLTRSTFLGLVKTHLAWSPRAPMYSMLMFLGMICVDCGWLRTHSRPSTLSSCRSEQCWRQSWVYECAHTVRIARVAKTHLAVLLS